MAGPFAGAEDLDVFFSTSEFAESVTFSTSSGDVVATGIVDEPFIEDIGVTSSSVTMLFKEADVSTVEEGDTATRDDTSAYKVSHPPHPDGTGLVMIVLKVSV